MDLWVVHLPGMVENVDGRTWSERILSSSALALLLSRKPIQTHGDGNCLFIAESTGWFSTDEGLRSTYRLLATIELFTNQRFYDSDRQDYVDWIKDCRIVVDLFKIAVKDAATNGTNIEMLHIFALNSIMNQTIR